MSIVIEPSALGVMVGVTAYPFGSEAKVTVAAVPVVPPDVVYVVSPSIEEPSGKATLVASAVRLIEVMPSAASEYAVCVPSALVTIT